MKNLFSTFILGLVLTISFSSCQKEPPLVSSILYDGYLFIGQDIDFSSENTSPFSYSWNFGDGTTAQGGYHTHKYNAPGVYTVQLTVNSEGGSHTSTTTVNIKSYPKKVRIKSVKLQTLDFQRNWCPGSATGPDVYFNFTLGYTTGTPLSANSATSQNTTASQMPLMWGYSSPLELDYNEHKFINFYDDDNTSSDLIQSTSFLFADEIPFESNTISIPKLSLSNSPNIELEVEYIY